MCVCVCVSVCVCVCVCVGGGVSRSSDTLMEISHQNYLNFTLISGP